MTRQLANQAIWFSSRTASSTYMQGMIVIMAMALVRLGIGRDGDFDCNYSSEYAIPSSLFQPFCFRVFLNHIHI